MVIVSRKAPSEGLQTPRLPCDPQGYTLTTQMRFKSQIAIIITLPSQV